MNNETLTFLTNLCAKLDERTSAAYNRDDHGAAGYALETLTDSLREMMQEENPIHTCATKPWDWDRNQEEPKVGVRQMYAT